MLFLTLALSLFIITHLIPAFPKIKAALIEKVGRGGYIAAFSGFSLFSLGLIIYAKFEAPFIEVYEPADWSRHFAMTLMLPASVLGIASFLPGHIARRSRGPLFYATLLWVAAHLVANGDQASLLLFGSLGLYACLSRYLMFRQNGAAGKKTEKPHLWADGAAIIGGAITYVTLLYLHGEIIGVEVWY